MSRPRRDPGLLIVRADGGTGLGTGHVMRCLALAEAWRARGGRALLAGAFLDDALEARVRTDGIDVIRLKAPPASDDDAQRTVELAAARDASWVVLDGYHFGTEYQKRIKTAGVRILCIDDWAAQGSSFGDLILDQNLGPRPELYASRPRHSRLLLGPRYALLRREFHQRPVVARPIPARARRVLVTLGSSVSEGPLSKVLDALNQTSSRELEIRLVGSLDKVTAQRVTEARRTLPFPVSSESLALDMRACVEWAEIGISAAGITSWELCFMGLPALLIQIADNQRAVAEALDAAGAAQNLGWWENLSGNALSQALNSLAENQDRRREMSQRGRALVDGQGVRRVVDAMLVRMVLLRPATSDDCRLVWEWANDSETRQASFERAPIPWESHQRWFAAKLGDPSCAFFIAIDHAGKPIGQLRLDFQGEVAIISVGLAPGARGHGYGAEVITQGTREGFLRSPIFRVEAYIRPDNERSRRAFASAQYREEGTVQVKRERGLKMIARREDYIEQAD